MPRRFRTLKFAPAVHVNYGETVLRMKDGLPKMKDFPAELGGSGETLPEYALDRARDCRSHPPKQETRGWI